MVRIMVPIHVRMPVSMVTEIDERTKHRSQYIRTAITKHLADDAPTVADADARILMAALSSRKDCDDTLRLLLIALLQQ